MIPTTAAAYSLNLTVVPHGLLHYLTIWPAGLNQPLVSTLNAEQGQTVANAAIVPAGSNGNVSVFVTDDTDLVIDIDGYFAFSSQVGNPVNHARTNVTMLNNTTPSTVQLSWASPFPDTNYTVTCTPQAATSTQSGFYIFRVSAVTTNCVSVDLAANIFNTGVYPFNFTIHCIGIHD